MGEPKAGVFVTHPSSFTTQLFWMGKGFFVVGFSWLCLTRVPKLGAIK